MFTRDQMRWIRRQFPALSVSLSELSQGAQQSSPCQINVQEPAIFMDGPGGTQVPSGVMEAMNRTLRTTNANAHGAFITSQILDLAILDARQAAADLLGCERQEIVFGANMTTLSFALSRALGRWLHPGDEVMVTQLDHDANIAPWQALQEQGILVRQVQIQPRDCTLDLEDFRAKLNSCTRLVAFGAASNVVGTINPMAQIIDLAHEVGAWVFLDAVHYIPHRLLDVQVLDCDFLVCSAYKFFGPHLGILFGKRQLLETITPYKVRPAPNTVPERWETGTQNFEGITGLHAAIQYLQRLGVRLGATGGDRRTLLNAAFAGIEAHEQALCEALIEGLQRIPGLQIYGICDHHRLHQRTPTISLRIPGHTPAELAQALGNRGVFSWHGDFYAQNLADRLGVAHDGGFLRIGLVHYNTLSEVQRMLNALSEIVAHPQLFVSSGGLTLDTPTDPLP